MEYIITESQLKRIIKEEEVNEFSNSIKKMNSFTRKLVNSVLKNYNINIKMLLTWGVSVAGLMMPIDKFIRDGNFDLQENEVHLILAGLSFLFFFEGASATKEILNKIKENGLEKKFQMAYLKASQLKNAFFGFLSSLKIVSSQFLEIISYCFLIPIIGDIQSLAQDSVNIKETAILITERLIASGTLVVSRHILSSIISKILKRLK